MLSDHRQDRREAPSAILGSEALPECITGMTLFSLLYALHTARAVDATSGVESLVGKIITGCVDMCVHFSLLLLLLLRGRIHIVGLKRAEGMGGAATPTQGVLHV
jgi:hypothetical protein